MTNFSETYYCEHCQKEYFLTSKEKKICPDCKKSLLSLECTKEDFNSYSQEERDIVIESNLLRERKKEKNNNLKFIILIMNFMMKLKKFLLMLLLQNGLLLDFLF